ncbi:flagellar protein FlhE [Pectobacterium sp. B1J-3]|uniref:flagellar protein FlhE n=1 Tax=Pectobacterium sp. B1J-3 TaxID=3385371 RepID=UPI0039060F92
MIHFNINRVVAGLLFFSVFTLFSMSGHAAQGSWDASRAGVTLNYRGEVASSPAFLPSPAQGVMHDSKVTIIYWRSETDRPAPPGLFIKLCTAQRCVNVDNGVGQTQAFSGTPANSEFRFVYYIEGGGRLIPAFNVRSIDLAVNYE